MGVPIRTAMAGSISCPGSGIRSGGLGRYLGRGGGLGPIGRPIGAELATQVDKWEGDIAEAKGAAVTTWWIFAVLGGMAALGGVIYLVTRK